LGTVSFFKLGQSAEIIDHEVEFRELLKSTRDVVGERPALNLILVQDMSKLFAVGKPGGTPGLTMWHGSYIGGVAMEVSSDGHFDALVLRHQVGHMAGLFHTTERTDMAAKGKIDALDDTPSCDDTLKLDFCPDAANVMFPVPNSAWSGALTAQQTAVVHGSTLYLGMTADEAKKQPQSHPGAAQLRMASDASRNTPPGSADASWRRSWMRHAEDLDASTRHDLLTTCGNSPMRHDPLTEAARTGLHSLATDDSAPSYIRRRASRLLRAQ
jgi:hypothetical protein